MAMVERAECSAQTKRPAEETELQQLLHVTIATMHSEPVFAGAA